MNCVEKSDQFQSTSSLIGQLDVEMSKMLPGLARGIDVWVHQNASFRVLLLVASKKVQLEQHENFKLCNIGYCGAL